MLRIGVDAFHRTDHHALRLVEMADAFGAPGGIDHVDLSPIEIALFGQTGSQTSQLTQSSLIFSDIAWGLPFACGRPAATQAAGTGARPRGRRRDRYLASSKM